MNPTNSWPGVIRRYAAYLPVTAETPVVTLLEGNTPLISAPNFVEAIGGSFQLFLKYEALNPTCSFKDRGMTLAVSKAKERGAQVVICASTGNTSASAAAYAARAGLKCVVLLPKGKIALGKLSQSLMYGAMTISIEGNFDDALRIVRELGETGKAASANLLWASVKLPVVVPNAVETTVFCSLALAICGCRSATAFSSAAIWFLSWSFSFVFWTMRLFAC